jgi:sulfite reductase (ferredoxin)
MSHGPKSKVELHKETSDGLRGTLPEEMAARGTPLSDGAKALIKHHGVYEQDDRDGRKRGERAHSFMVRSKIPGGVLTAEQYLVHDDLATRHANGTLRITTRQDFQLHGVLKGDVRPALAEINHALLTTLGACGDVVRNVACCPAPATGALRAEVDRVVAAISERLLPRTRAYHELWLDGEIVHGGETVEPFYGTAYLPRKFKIGVALPGDNCIDVFTQDLGLVAFADERGALAGFDVLVGGGLGMTHTKPGTFPRLGDLLGFVPPEHALATVEAIVAVQRDHGDRGDRRHARLKYLIHDRGLAWFRREVEAILPFRLAPERPLPPFELELHLGWQRQDARRSSLGLSVENGRLSGRLRAGVRAVVERLRPEVRLTANQDLLLAGIDDERRAEVDRILREHHVLPPEALSLARTHSMACPALPTCGLALAEAERALPAVIDRLELELAALGLGGEKLTIRMTGCPNGCARPYVADLAFVGRSLDRYLVLVGGRRDGSRLNRAWLDLVPASSLVDAVLPLFRLFRDARRPGESFGDFCDRLGIEALRAQVGAGREAAANE